MVVGHQVATSPSQLDRHHMVTVVVMVVRRTVMVVVMVDLMQLSQPVHLMVFNQQANILTIIQKNLIYLDADPVGIFETLKLSMILFSVFLF
jgi:hypothetical protein